MARKKADKNLISTLPPTIHEAHLGDLGAVVRGPLITLAAAVERRRHGLDVVVCGVVLSANRSLAATIEVTASGVAIRHPPHPNAGPESLPHYQLDSRPPSGHTFYETPNRKTR